MRAAWEMGYIFGGQAAFGPDCAARLHPQAWQERARAQCQQDRGQIQQAVPVEREQQPKTARRVLNGLHLRCLSPKPVFGHAYIGRIWPIFGKYPKGAVVSGPPLPPVRGRKYHLSRQRPSRTGSSSGPLSSERAAPCRWAVCPPRPRRRRKPDARHPAPESGTG